MSVSPLDPLNRHIFVFLKKERERERKKKKKAFVMLSSSGVTTLWLPHLPPLKYIKLLNKSLTH